MNEQQYLENLQRLWDKNWPSELPKEPHYPFGEILITDYLRKRAELTPDKACIIYYGLEVTFKQLDDWSNRFASYLLSIGVKKGDRVAVFLPNCPQFLIAFYGILKAGCVHVPVNPMFKEQELLYELNDAGAEIIVTLDHLYSLVQKVKAQTSLREVVTTSLKEFLPQKPTIPLHHSMPLQPISCPDTTSFLSIIENSDYSSGLGVNVNLDDLAALNYTGGTTGMPKGCEHTQRNMLYTAACIATFSFSSTSSEDQVGLNYLPIFWIAGENSIIGPVFKGVTQVLLYRWDVKAVLEAIQRYKLSGVGGVLDNMIELMEYPELEKYDLSSIQATSVSSFVKKLSIEYRQRWKTLTGVTMKESAFGMTETHTMDTFTTGLQTDDMDLKAQPVFCGLPMPGTKIKIVDFESGELLPLGQEGEIVIKTPSLLKGYWNKPEATKKSFSNGWFHTGDIGVLDEEGFLHYLGRRKEMLKVNGMSVFPSEIETIMGKMPGSEGCGVVGQEDTEKGQIPIAFVKLNADYQDKLNEEKIYQWCKENMAIYKVPVIKIIDELPLTATGKVRKVELEKMLEKQSL
ncbi:acyl-CoA synthetase [Pueribacillus theae]|uniref:Acyl-CoA synthetase n=1 Tax=Pueribacillus theae TaxID=2171751 RepID=A0A2U1K6P9_9BACI|nr:AMP-binding protein [Pueribacillus theae]PWA12849.1 acyl-CoA synthetase [Pueribacillus theae]